MSSTLSWMMSERDGCRQRGFQLATFSRVVDNQGSGFSSIKGIAKKQRSCQFHTYIHVDLDLDLNNYRNP